MGTSQRVDKRAVWIKEEFDFLIFFLLIFSLLAVIDPERIAQNEDCQMGCENGVCVADHGGFKCM